MLKTAMSTSPNHAFYGHTNYWDVARPGDYSIPYRPRTDVDRTALPPIRLVCHVANPQKPCVNPLLTLCQAIPELARPPHSTTSPIASAPGSSTSEYVHSPNSNKRRRDSIGDEDRARCVPRYYNDPHRPVERRPSQPVSPAYAQRAIPEPWAHSTQATPPLPPGGLPAMRSPVSGRMEPFERHEARPALPSFPPPMGMERGPAPAARVPGPVRDEYTHEAPRAMYTPCPDPRYDGGLYRPVTYAFNPHPHPHPPRMQSLSLGAIPVPDRSPFSTNGYAAYGEYVRFGDGITMSGDNKQRKRRGNLPKETTDILRKWFLAHITHPYPSEEEKQSLMRETGLQMSKLSCPPTKHVFRR